jgi:hypothetical protein
VTTASSTETETVPAGPPIIEGPGRYVVYKAPDGGWIIARAGELCGSCASCGCGEQAEPITIPAFAIAMAAGQGRARLMAMLKGVSGRG